MPRWSIAQLWGARLLRYLRRWSARHRRQGRPPHRDPLLPVGASREPEFSSWRAMWRRCTDEAYRHYYLYGGRGIRVHPAWQSYVQFKTDVGSRPPGLTLDRKDPNGHYEPGNVRWATPKQQANNRRWSGRRVA